MKTLKFIIILAPILLGFESLGQSIFANPDLLFNKSKSRPEVLVVGTFHFSYPNLDAHKTEETDRINIFSEKRQNEIDELAAYIARFKPTSIVVESGENTGYLMYDYREMKSSGKLDKADERRQLGFRLLDLMQLDTLYGCDSYSMIKDMTMGKDSLVMRSYISEVTKDYDWHSDDKLDSLYDIWYDSMDKELLHMTILEYFKIMNAQNVIEYMHGAYLIGDFGLADYKGVDAMTMIWYNRNLRIFRNIQTRVPADDGERILVLFGAGHTSILKEQFRASPQYKLVDFEDLEKPKSCSK